MVLKIGEVITVIAFITIMRNLLFIGIYAKGQEGPKSRLYIPLHYITCLEPLTEEEYKVSLAKEANFHNPAWDYYTSLPAKYRDEIIFPMQSE